MKRARMEKTRFDTGAVISVVAQLDSTLDALDAVLASVAPIRQRLVASLDELTDTLSSGADTAAEPVAEKGAD